MRLGIDIGGTFVKAGIVDDDGVVLARSSVPTDRTDAKGVCESALLAGRRAMVRAAVQQVRSVGVGSTGSCDAVRGVIAYSPNLPGRDIPVGRVLSDALGAPVIVENDARCAAMGEYVASGRRVQNFLLVTLGTGVGGGIILGGKLYRGHNGAAGEVGHMTIVTDGHPCKCGQNGCWEQYASVTALVRMTRESDSPFLRAQSEINGKSAFLAARAGDAQGAAVLEKWLRYVGIGVVNLVNIFQPESLVIGGGISREGEVLLAPLRRYVAEHCFTSGLSLSQTEISAAQLGNDAGLIGAAMLE